MKIDKAMRSQIVRDLDKIRQEINTRIADAIEIISGEDCDCSIFEHCGAYGKYDKQLTEAERAIKKIRDYTTAIDTIAR